MIGWKIRIWMTAMHDEHLQDHYLHLSTHRKVLDFDPRNTENPIVLDYLMNPAEHNARMDRMKSISMSEINPYVTLMTPVIPPSYRVLMQENVMLWVALIHRMVFDERLYGLFYGEYANLLDRVVNIKTPDRDSIIYREYKTGYSIFHIAAKLRILDRLTRDLTLSVGQKIKGLDNELTYILKCYTDLGKVFRSGNELTINYMEDFSGVYLSNFLTNFVDDLVNGSLF